MKKYVLTVEEANAMGMTTSTEQTPYEKLKTDIKKALVEFIISDYHMSHTAAEKIVDDFGYLVDDYANSMFCDVMKFIDIDFDKSTFKYNKHKELTKNVPFRRK